MSTRVVCDASALVALPLGGGRDGAWVTQALTGADLAAPSLVGFESANIIRRLELSRLVGADQAAQAHADLLDLSIEQWPYAVLARERGSSVGACRATTPAMSPWRSSREQRSSHWTEDSAARPIFGA